MTAGRRHALALAQLRGMLRASGVRPSIRAYADRALSAAITHLMGPEEIGPDPSAAAAPGPDPAQMEIGLDAPDRVDPRPWHERD